MLVFETKGSDTDLGRINSKHLAVCIKAINQCGGLGRWAWDVSTTLGYIRLPLAC